MLQQLLQQKFRASILGINSSFTALILKMSDLNFQGLVDRFYKALYRFALSLARNEDDACDLTQQTFALWAIKGHQLRDPTKVKTWLFTTLYREFSSRWRHQVRFPHLDIEVCHHELPSAEPEMAEKLDAEQLMSFLSEIDDVYRAPLVLFYLQEHSYKEISAILDIPIGTVMSRISRGKQQLRQKLIKFRTEESKSIPFPEMKNRIPNG